MICGYCIHPDNTPLEPPLVDAKVTTATSSEQDITTLPTGWLVSVLGLCYFHQDWFGEAVRMRSPRLFPMPSTIMRQPEDSLTCR